MFQATNVQKKLQDAGFDAKQAFGIASVLEADVVSHIEETLVTQDRFEARMAQLDARFSQLEAKLDSRFAQVDSRFAQMDSRFAQVDSRIAESKAELLKWTVGLILGSSMATILTLIRFLK